MHAARLILSLACALTAAVAQSGIRLPPTGTRYFHADHRGDIVLSSDEARAAVARTVHRPWGGRGARTLGPRPATRTFDGWEQDYGTGLLYAGARYYDHALGRFLSVDPARQGIYAALAGAPLANVDPDGRVWYRFFTARGIPAFRLGANMRYERVVEQWELRAVPAEREASHPTDVYVHVKDLDDRYRQTWDREYLDGIIRRDLYPLDRRLALVEAYIEQRKVPPDLRERLRKNMNQWMVRNRAEDDGSAAPLARDPGHPQPPSAQPRLPGRPGAPLRRISRLPDPAPGVSVVRPSPVRGGVRRRPPVAVRRPLFQQIAREAMEPSAELPAPFVLDPPPASWPGPASRRMLLEWGWGPRGTGPRRR